MKTTYIETQNLIPLLRDYTNPFDFVARLGKKRELIRLKNGFFVIAERIKNLPVPYEQIGNLLYPNCTEKYSASGPCFSVQLG